MTVFSAILEASVLLLSLYLLRRWVTIRTARDAIPLPPGPRRLPILGNLLNRPKNNPWLTLTKWAEEYGDIVYMNVIGVPVIILGSPSVASALLDAKGRIYSDRPPVYFADKMVGWGDSFIRKDDGPEVKDSRRFLTQELGSKTGLERFGPVVDTEILKFLRRTLEDPQGDRLLYNIRSLFVSIILEAGYGYQIKEGYDEFVDLAEKSMDAFTKNLTPGARLVDSFPWLDCLPSWMPGTAFKKDAVDIRKFVFAAIESPYCYTKEQMAAGVARPSFVASRLESGDYTSDNALMWVAASIYGGATDTTSSTVSFFFLFMAMHPEIQAKAQAEIGAVIAADNRLPVLSDMDQMPYVRAIIKETLRCGTITPVGVPHKLREDDVSKGYFIPKDSVVIVNAWRIAHDAQIYPQPDVFNPSRFLGDNPQLDPHEYIFGYGRRRCPGIRWADDNLYIACARVLATFNISDAVDINGQKITMDSDYATGLGVLHPKPFHCTIKARSNESKNLVCE